MQVCWQFPKFQADLDGVDTHDAEDANEGDLKITQSNNHRNQQRQRSKRFFVGIWRINSCDFGCILDVDIFLRIIVQRFQEISNRTHWTDP